MGENTPHLYSLRKRALYSSALISIVVFIIVFFAYGKVNNTNEKAISNAQNRTVLLTMLNHMRSNLLASYKDLNNFLLTPDETEYKKTAQSLLHNTINTSQQLRKKIAIFDATAEQRVITLNTQLEKLETDFKQLIKVRLDSNTQYPALAVAAEYMRPNRSKINDLFTVIKNEMQLDNTIDNQPRSYEAFISTRHLWNKMLSNFRIYLANRVGSFDQPMLNRQEAGIRLTYKEFHKNLAQLNALADKNQLGFESAYAVTDIKPSAEAWFEGFEKIAVIHHSGNWRQDALRMKNVISPEIDNIINLLIEIELAINITAESDFLSFTQFSKEQNKLLWIIAIIGIVFIITIILSLDRFIFKPITQVVAALKSEALGKASNIVPSVKSQEAYDLFSAFSEMSRQVHLRQNELEYRALHDSLTALPNRTLLLDRMEHDLNTAKRENQNLCLLVLDLDRFKEVNDTLGHSVGDHLLIVLGERLTKILRDVDTVARFGGDEFAILLPHTGESEAKLIAEKIIDALKDVILIDSIELYITASIGISSFPTHSDDVNELLRLADIAMYVAKRNKTGYEVYSSKNDEHSISKLSLTNDLRDAIENNLLTIYYQPVFGVNKNITVGMESLCRWFHPELGSIPPDNFIPLAEQTGLINELTYWVLENSIKQVSKWHEIEPELTIAVNISVHSFRDRLFVSSIRSILEKFDFQNEKLTLEITESAMMENPRHAIEILTELHQMGVKLAVDDFGTGYSSMAYLKKLPVDELKIDKSFVLGLHEDKSNEAIVRATIDLAHNLDLHVVAEGVESEAAWALLAKYNCDTAQGFYMSKPMSAKQIEAHLVHTQCA